MAHHKLGRCPNQKWMRKLMTQESPDFSHGECQEHPVLESFPSVVVFESKNNQNNSENNRYYAIIMVDGDDMGKWINGDDGKILDGFDKVDERYHKEFSRRLTVFSKEKVPTIVGDKSNENGPPKKGKLVYAGGDDVLAFMKLKDLLPTVKQLRSTFSSDEVLGKKATVSMGIVIAHKKVPLQLVIQTVQQMEATEIGRAHV